VTALAEEGGKERGGANNARGKGFQNMVVYQTQ